MLSLLLSLIACDKALRDELKSLYRDHRTYSYDLSRNVMYNELECFSNYLHLIYQSTSYYHKCHTQIKPNGNEVNAEHIVPQSYFGKALPMVSDLHHIRGSGASSNSARSNYGFAEDSYSKCTRYCDGDSCWKGTPPQPQDKYGCVLPGPMFMPPARDRGIIARAVLYFATVYDEYYSIIDSRMSGFQTLLKWNAEHPPLWEERQRNEKLNITQGNRNPYIDDPSLADRAFS